MKFNSWMIHFYFLFILLHSSFANIQFGEPVLKYQAFTFQGSQAQAMQVDLPLLLPPGVDNNLTLLVNNFICPAPLDPSLCRQPPPCSCNFAALSCAALPPCCASHPAFPSACLPGSPASWHPVLPGSPLRVLAQPSLSASFRPSPSDPATYLRYHPSPAAQCSGFGISLQPPFDEVSEVISTDHHYLVFLSWTHARPELDPNAVSYSPRAASGYRTWKERFCPDPFAGASSAQSRFFGPSNTQTLFVSVFSLTASLQKQLVPLWLDFTLVETLDVSLLAQSFQQSAVPFLSDRQTIVSPPAQPGSFLAYIYAHALPYCANVGFDAHALEGGDPDLFLGFSPSHFTWLSAAFGPADSITVNFCPGEVVFFAIQQQYTTSSLLVSVVVDPPIESPLLSEINPHVLSARLTETYSSRTVCNDTLVALAFDPAYAYIVRTPDGRFVGRCFDSWTQGTDVTLCGNFFAIPSYENATILWPPPPSGLLGSSAQKFNTTTLSRTLGEYSPSVLSFASVWSTKLFNPVSPGFLVGFNEISTQEFLAECTIQFTNTIVTRHGDRLTGETSPFPTSTMANYDCRPESVSVSIDALQSISEGFSTAEFSQQDAVSRNTALLSQVAQSLVSDYASCSYITQHTFLNSSAAQSGVMDCSLVDPCCPLSGAYVGDFFSFCFDSPFVNTAPELDRLAIEAHCPEWDTCIEALMDEVAQSQSVITHFSSAATATACSIGESQYQLLKKTIVSYYQTCKVKYLGDFDEGIPCQLDADCPAPLVCSLDFLPQPSSVRASWRQRIPKTCQAPSAVFDTLVYDCLFVTMPQIITSKFLSLIYGPELPPHLPIDDPAFLKQTIWDYVSSPGCQSAFPSPLVHLAPSFPLDLVNNDPNFESRCALISACPLPIRCLDPLCALSPVCSPVYSFCAYTFTAQAQGPQQQLCQSSFQCNLVVDATSGPHLCSPDGDQSACNAECQSLHGTGFCGYCENDNDDNNTTCYRAVSQSTGLPLSQQECQQQQSGCFFADLLLVESGACTDRGVCTHRPPTSPTASPTTPDQCAALPGLCLQKEDRRMMFGSASGGCLGTIQPNTQGCQSAIQSSPSGCLWVDGYNQPTMFLTPSQCVNQTDPYSILGEPFRGWIDKIVTEDACVHDPRLFVCYLPTNDTSPLSDLPNFNAQADCLRRGGSYRSPYVWEDPQFLPGVPVQLSWIATKAVPSGSWADRLDFATFSSVIQAVVEDISIQSESLTALCTYSSVSTVATEATSCSCADSPTLACDAFSVVNKHQLPPAQPLGSVFICEPNSAADPFVTYPSALFLPPLELSFTAKSTLQSAHWTLVRGCITLSADLYSNSRFVPRRARIRETSFFISRQDVHIPPLSTLSSLSVANGFILSDAVALDDRRSGSSATHVRLCITPRRDFLLRIQNQSQTEEGHNHNHHPKASEDSYLTFGFLSGWAVVPFSSPPQSISVDYLLSNGTLQTSFDQHLTGELTDIVQICRVFSKIDLDDAGHHKYVAVLTFKSDPEDTPNGFNTAETVWLYITASLYLLPVIFIWIPISVRTILQGESPMRVSALATTFLSGFLIFRSALLFGLAAGSIGPSSTTEFALTDIASWCQFSGICLLSIAMTNISLKSAAFRQASPFEKSSSLKLIFGAISLFLLALFIAFVIAYSQTGNSSSGISSPSTLCAGRVPAGAEFWSTRRILRFTYEVLLVFFSFVLGIWLFWISCKLGTAELRFYAMVDILCFCIISHGIIALIFIATGYNNFAFGLVMLYFTELIPVTGFFILALWNSIHSAASSLKKAMTTRSSSSSDHRRV